MWKAGRMSYRIDSNETSFQYGLVIVRIHAAPEATMKDLMDYSTILQTSTVKSSVPIPHTDSERQPTRNCYKLTNPDNMIGKGRADENDKSSAAEELLVLA